MNQLVTWNFGEYLRIMENDECWKMLNLPFDKSDFTNNLHSIRNIRNAVMYFHPDKISKQDLDSLRKTSRFLENYFNIK